MSTHNITYSELKKGEKQVFENIKTGEKIRYDYGQPGLIGYEEGDHYHRYNPDAPKGAKGDKARYLDKDGKPIGRLEAPGHLHPPEGVKW